MRHSKLLRQICRRPRDGYPWASLGIAIAVLLIQVPMLRADDVAPPSAEHVEFFEQHVRPLLAEKCWSCHGSQKQQGGLRLDSRAAMLKGNESGPGVDMQNRSASRILQVIAYSGDDVQMPPQGKLSETQVAAITKWIELGAPWPEKAVAPASAPTPDHSGTHNHWSFQPMRSVTPPSVRDAGRAQTPIDAFILSALEANGLSLSPAADRATFLRRATFDLWGLPPTYAEVQDFVHDDRPDAVERLIDRLLASPRYGERWARYWLDIARYADTKGYVFTAEPRYPYAYTYRDYVIDAFNADKPYDRFVLEQLAADQLDDIDSPKTLAAMGFLTVGRRFLNKNEDIIDDRIDVVCRGLMALTVGCARCHDHKFDPVPTADYYSLYGVFASCTEPDDLPIIGEPSERSEYEKFLEELNKRQQKLADFEQKTRDNIGKESRERITAYLEQVTQPAPSGRREAFRSVGPNDPRPQMVQRWRDYLEQRSKSHDPVFGPWQQWIGKSGDEYSTAVQTWCVEALQPGRFDAGDERVNLLVRQAIIEHAPLTPKELAAVYGALLLEVHQRWDAWKAVQSRCQGAARCPRRRTEATPLRRRHADRSDRRGRQVANLQPGRARPAAQPAEADRRLASHVGRRPAPRDGAPRPVATDGAANLHPRQLRPAGRSCAPAVSTSGRGTRSASRLRTVVAGWIWAGRSSTLHNPLTARVIVNRVWQHHFGKGLVRTPGDFGVRGEPPTHPELLDYLALRLIESGWSLKELHREIMMSAVYQQSSVGVPASAGLLSDPGPAKAGTPTMIDPENRLLWQFPRRRLDLEAVRDSWLAAADVLDGRIGGRPFDSISDPAESRRTIYGLVNRNDLPGVFRVFDFADPDASAPERPQTTVPQQALFGMNSPFLRENAKRLSAAIVKEGMDDSARVEALYRQALSRDPDSLEREQALEFVRSAGNEGKMSAWERLAQVLLLTNEFAFVD